MTRRRINILFIEGLSAGSWYQNTFWNCQPIEGQKPFDGHFCFRVWCTVPYLNDDDEALPPDGFGMEKCVSEIESGKYHAIVVVDYSLYVMKFDQYLARPLQAFVEAGGVVAFPTTEVILLDSLMSFFDVEWEFNSYYRSTWSPCEENLETVRSTFCQGSLSDKILEPYSAKANTLVTPTHERCYGSAESNETAVAVHEYGEGAIAYFGDVNGEDPTLWLIAAFLESRAPNRPIDNRSELSEADFEAVMLHKKEGNESFGASDWDLAEQDYSAAIAVYEIPNRLGSNGPQRDTLVTLYSNLSMVYLKKNLYHQAETAASKSLNLEPNHTKALYRRATARLKIGQNRRAFNRKLIEDAREDVLRCDPNDATRKLLAKIDAEMKRLEKRERDYTSAVSDTTVEGRDNQTSTSSSSQMDTTSGVLDETEEEFQPTIVRGKKYRTINAELGGGRYVFMGEDENGEPQYLDYGRPGGETEYEKRLKENPNDDSKTFVDYNAMWEARFRGD